MQIHRLHAVARVRLLASKGYLHLEMPFMLPVHGVHVEHDTSLATGGVWHSTMPAGNLAHAKAQVLFTAGNLIHAKAQDEGSGPPTQTTGPEGNVKVGRLMGAVEYGRPLAQPWNGTLGVNFQRANCLDDHNQPLTKVALQLRNMRHHDTCFWLQVLVHLVCFNPSVWGPMELQIQTEHGTHGQKSHG